MVLLTGGVECVEQPATMTITARVCKYRTMWPNAWLTDGSPSEPMIRATTSYALVRHQRAGSQRHAALWLACIFMALA